jgi:hypothetical protein
MSLFKTKSSSDQQWSSRFSANHFLLLLTSTSTSTSKQTPRRRFPDGKKNFIVATSLVIFSMLLTASAERLPHQGEEEVQVPGQVEDDWLKSEKDVRMLEKIISNLYGRENPFNLLAKRNGGGGGGKHHNNAAKLEKQFAKRNAYKENTDIGLIRQHEGKNKFMKI